VVTLLVHTGADDAAATVLSTLVRNDSCAEVTLAGLLTSAGWLDTDAAMHADVPIHALISRGVTSA